MTSMGPLTDQPIEKRRHQTVITSVNTSVSRHTVGRQRKVRRLGWIKHGETPSVENLGDCGSWPIASELMACGTERVAHVRTLWFDAMNEFRIRDLVNLR